MPITEQLLNHWRGVPGPFVQWNPHAQLKIYDSLDRIKPVLRRFKPRTRWTLRGEQPHP